MPNEEKMTLSKRRKHLRLIETRYLKASKLERGRLLDEMEVITGLHRKGLIRLASGSLERRRWYVERLWYLPLQRKTDASVARHQSLWYNSEASLRPFR